MSADTPMMRQYLAVKEQQPDAILLMRMGDFYEAFLKDAEDLARLGGVTLTCRNRDDANPIPMAGIPHHQLDNYLPKLIAAGRRVAVMDQLEDPATAKEDGRTLVKRGLTRLITPGTLVDERQLDPGTANRLVTLTGVDPEVQPVGIAALDVSTGRFTVEEAATPQALAVALARLSPAELVLPDTAREQAEALAIAFAPAIVPPIAYLAAWAWKPADARRQLCDRLGVASLDGFDLGPGHDQLCAAAAAALRYAGMTLTAGAADAPTSLSHIRTLTRLRAQGGLVLDATCRRNLDLLRNSRDGTRAGTLLSVVDRTKTAPGARLLADWLARPLAEVAPISDRQDAVAALVAEDTLRTDVRESLGRIYDLERLVARVATGRAHARDLVHLATSLEAAEAVGRLLTGKILPPLLAEAIIAAGGAPDLAAEIRTMLVEEPPLAISEGGVIRDGVDTQVDECRSLKRDAGAWLAAYQAKEGEALGLKTLKVGYNQIFGYYIELPKVASQRAPAHFVRKQTLVNAERYITPELKEYEDKALHAEDRLRARELALFTALRERAEAAIPALQSVASALALIDVCAGLAETARLGGWCRPVVDDSTALEFADARHPVVEASLGRGRFVANGCALDAAATPKLIILTGPNMAGKSTWIRQVAVAVILAQAGSFVPAASARIGLVDRVFTRVGAGDELARNLSTFMVEMAETAAILHHATKRSLVVLDEVGRGTSTFDGLSLAWAICEHLHDRIACRTLFATHYHELTDLEAERPGIANHHVAVAERDGEVAFLHRILPGPATKSYGIHVARLAGVPATVVTRAKEVLAALEQLNTDLTASGAHVAPPTQTTVIPSKPVQLTLFGPAFSPTLDRLKGLDVDNLSPRQALALLGELQAQAKSE